MKYTNKQKKAIDSLLFYLDELENKPRRLFGALRDIAEVFDKKEAIPSLREAEEYYYKYLTEGEKYDLLFDSLRDFKIQTGKGEVASEFGDHNRANDMIDAVERFVHLHIRNMTDEKFNMF